MSKSIADKKAITIKQAIDSFLLSCKVEGKSYGTMECYADKLKGFLWYANNYHWPDDIRLITTDHLREFLASENRRGLTLIVHASQGLTHYPPLTVSV